VHTVDVASHTDAAIDRSGDGAPAPATFELGGGDTTRATPTYRMASRCLAVRHDSPCFRMELGTEQVAVHVIFDVGCNMSVPDADGTALLVEDVSGSTAGYRPLGPRVGISRDQAAGGDMAGVGVR
jgi:hypothetical protein